MTQPQPADVSQVLSSEEGKSRTATVYTLAKALKTAAEELTKGNEWYPAGPASNKALQRILLEQYYPSVKAEVGRIEEIIVKVSSDHEVLNKFIREFCKAGIQFQPFNKVMREFGVVSHMDLKSRWFEQGKKGRMQFLSVLEVPSVSMEKGFVVFEVEGYPYPIAKIATEGKDGTPGRDSVYITIADEALGGFELVSKAASIGDIVRGRRIPNSDYDELIFPMIDLTYNPDISWLLEMEIRSDALDEPAWFISQAMQETTLKANEKGFAVKDTVAISVMLRASIGYKRKLVIDRPFYYWIERPGLSFPLFSSWITSDALKDPGEVV